jgi:hypothetical protein
MVPSGTPAADADSGRVVASVPADKDAADGAQVRPLWSRLTLQSHSFPATGRVTETKVDAASPVRHIDAAVIVPPRSSAMSSNKAEAALKQRHLHVRCIQSLAGWAGSKPQGATRVL